MSDDSSQIIDSRGYFNPWRLLECVQIPLWLLARADINPPAKLVYAALMGRANQNGIAKVPIVSLAAVVGLTPARTATAIRELVDAGLVEEEREKGRGGNAYRFYARPWDIYQPSEPQKAPANGRQNDQHEVESAEKTIGSIAKRLLDLAWQLCRECNHPPFVVRGPIAINALKKLVTTYGENDAKWLVETFYRTPPKWHLENGLLAPEYIPSAAQRLLAKRRNGGGEADYQYRDIEIDGKLIRQFLENGVVVDEVER